MRKWLCAALALCTAFSCCAQPAAAADTGGIVSLPILMYHHISPESARWSDFTVSPATFEGDLQYLRAKGYTTIHAAALDAYARGAGTLPAKPILITFDDGQASFAAYAQPLLEQYGMCAVLAVVGQYADTYTETEDKNIGYSYASWPELRALAASPCVELAAHTYDMHRLDTRRGCLKLPGESAADYAQALSADLARLEQRFSAAIGARPTAFAYPFGFYCDAAQALLCARGYTVLFTCEERINRLTGDPQELLRLGRFNRGMSAERVSFFRKMGVG